jgi:outer membrane protein assembly factor BamA
MGYVYSYNSSQPGQTNRQVQSLRVGVESGGNLTYLGFRLFANENNKNENGAYQIFNTPFSQYAKVDFDYARSTKVDSHNSLAWRVGLGVAYPYLNSQILPFEKRYYAGGANSVRGWSVRTLGPGIFAGNNNESDLMAQSGDIRLDLSLEYRTKLFWIMELGSYIDAGNVWTIRNYDSQPGGLFEFNKFYEQIAVSYGLGLRFDFSFFLIRLDIGMKAYNPALKGSDRWSLIQPDFKRDFALHFAIGYPF